MKGERGLDDGRVSLAHACRCPSELKLDKQREGERQREGEQQGMRQCHYGPLVRFTTLPPRFHTRFGGRLKGYSFCRVH